MLLLLSLIEIEEDKTKFMLIYEQYKDLMFYVARNILKRKEDAEDAVHDSFVKIIKNLDKISDVYCHRTKSFIVIVTERTSFDMLRKSKRLKEVSLDEEFLDDETDIESMQVEGLTIAQAIAKLPPRYREILLLKYDNELDNKEIADLLNISEENVRKLIQRAKHRLEKELKD